MKARAAHHAQISPPTDGTFTRRRSTEAAPKPSLDAALWLLRNELRASGEVTPTAVRVLDASLRLTGDDGAEHRAVIAGWLAFLPHALPDWLESNRDILFGSEAPEGLAQSMIDDAIHLLVRPNAWLLENYRDMVHSAAERHIDRALDNLLVGMLWEVPGYSQLDVLDFVARTPAMMSAAGDRLGRLLAPSDTAPAHIAIGVSFWGEALGRADKLGESASDALQGYGWFAEATQIPPRFGHR